jgi:putative tryptophan/tyrosine transport system substrate-binding protein
LKRRNFITLVGGTVAGWSLPARAQAQPKVARVGMLIPAPVNALVTRLDFGRIRKEFADRGYVDGKTIIFEERGADGAYERLPALAAELVGLKVDVLIALSTPAARAAQHATTSIPIVMGSVGDPVGDGLVASLSRPGGNITGTTFLGPELVPKRLALLKELIPAATQIAVLWDPGAFSEQTSKAMVQQTDEAARGLGLRLRYVSVHGVAEFEPAFADMVKGQADAVLQYPNPNFYENRKLLAQLAAKYRLPAIFNSREFVEEGGLIAYGASVPDLNRRTAIFADKILKGAKPSDLPVEQPTTFEFAVSRKVAETLGITVPQTMLAAADLVLD